MRTAVTAILVVLVLLAVACSDEGRDAPPTAPLTSEADPTTTTTAPASDDQRLATDLTVRQQDFPPGWSHSQTADQVEDPADRCLKTGPLAAATGRAESDEFAKSDLTTASSIALVYPDATAARSAFVHASGDRTRACFDQALRAEIAGEGEGEEGVELRNTSFKKTDFPPLAEEYTAYEFTAETSGTDQPYHYSAHLVLVKAGRTVLAFAFGSIGDPVPLDEQQHVAGSVVTRALR